MKNLLLLLFSCIAIEVQAQDWTWIHGDSVAQSAGFFGTKGVQSSSNTPNGRQGGCFWTDRSGKFWLFGGDEGNSSNRNDLWRYDPSVNLWTWMTGDSAFRPPWYFGVKGVAGPMNTPPPVLGSTTWTDDSGNLWLFGGILPAWPILWKYNITTNQWTWIKGDTTGPLFSVYGIRGIPASSNRPGSRRWAKGWNDDSGNFWLFGGGDGYAASTVGWLNDIWKYSPSSNMWTWMGGDTVANAPSSYGTKGVAAYTNRPSGRGTYALWKDAQNRIWICGGQAKNAILSDLWRYDPGTNQWTWINGDSTTWNRVYGTKYQFASGNTPGVLNFCSYWVEGNALWLMGGSDAVGFFNDIWKYDIAKGQWAWMGGDSVHSPTGVYGIKGLASPMNKPGGRDDAYFWQDGAGRIYLMGGIGFALNPVIGGYLNDLWVLDYTRLAVSPQSSIDCISATPNPSKGKWTIRGSVDASTILSYVVVDMIGRRITEGSWVLSSGVLNQQLDLSKYPPGGYNLLLFTSDHHESIRLLLE